MDDLISRQAAIDAIGEKSDEIFKTKQKGATYPHDDFFQGMAYAENVVKQLPPAQPEQLGTNLAEVGTDCISRQAAIEEIERWLGYIDDDMVRRMQIGMKRLPPAQPERIKAKWLPIGIADAVGGESAMWGNEIAYHACDNCWQQALEKDGEEVLSDFCPHCGADMRGEQDE